MKQLFTFLLVALLVSGAIAQDWGIVRGGSRSIAAADTILSTTIDTIAQSLSGKDKSIIGAYITLTDLSNGEDSVYVRIYGAPTNLLKTSAAWALLQTNTLESTPGEGHYMPIYIPANATYYYNMPYFQARIQQCEGAAATDSMTYSFYWVYQKIK